MTPDDDAEYEQLEILEFVQMLQRRGRASQKRQIALSPRELDKVFAYAHIKGPCQEHLRVILSAARRGQ